MCGAWTSLKPLSSEQGLLSPKDNLMIVPYTPSLSIHPSIPIFWLGFKIMWRPVMDGEWVGRKRQEKEQATKWLCNARQQHPQRTHPNWCPSHGNGKVGKRAATLYHKQHSNFTYLDISGGKKTSKSIQQQHGAVSHAKTDMEIK
jgi:hypothetical protein